MDKQDSPTIGSIHWSYSQHCYAVYADGKNGYLLHNGDVITVVDYDGKPVEKYTVHVSSNGRQWKLTGKNAPVFLDCLEVIFQSHQ